MEMTSWQCGYGSLTESRNALHMSSTQMAMIAGLVRLLLLEEDDVP
jgi:hypothetical protein